MAHHHHERNHQGKDNLLLSPEPAIAQPNGLEAIQCRERLGGLLLSTIAKPYEYLDPTGTRSQHGSPVSGRTWRREAEYLERGHAVHFRCQHPEARNMRLYVISMTRGVEPFNQLWTHRTTVEFVPGIPVDPMSRAAVFAVPKCFSRPSALSTAPASWHRPSPSVTLPGVSLATSAVRRAARADLRARQEGAAAQERVCVSSKATHKGLCAILGVHAPMYNYA